MLAVLKVMVCALLKVLFRVELRGWEHYPHRDEQVLIVANHISFLDGVLLTAFLPDIPVFAIDSHMAQRWWVRPFIELTGYIIIGPGTPLYLKVLIQHLKEGERIAIFPEGRISVTGSLMKVYAGSALAADKARALILPVHIEGAQYSLLSRLKGKVRRRLLPRIRLTMLSPRRLEPPLELSGRERRHWLAERLDELMVELMYAGRPIDRPLFEALLEAKARHGSSRIIVEDSQRQPLSYRQLITRSFILSSLLERQSSGQRYVGIMLPTAVAAIATFLALHLRGQVPVMLNFTLGIQGLLATCRSAAVTTIYTARTFVNSAGLEGSVKRLGQEFKIVFLEDLRTQLSLGIKLRGRVYGLFPGWAYRYLAGRVSGEDAAVIVFTSGSEGMPKGMVLSHRNLLANHAQVCALLDIGPQDVAFNALALFHCFGLSTGALVPLLSGVKVFFCPSPLHYHLISELIYEAAASVLLATNTLLMGYGRSAHPYDFFNMRLVVAGAESLCQQTQQLWMDKFGIRVIEGYGVTEAGPMLATNTPKRCRTATVGRLVPGIEHYLEPVEGIAEGGRLWVRGANVMAGYLHSPGEWLPPRSERGEGWHDTGDIVSIDRDGFMIIKGRAKRFAKLAGEMISLAEVEYLACSVWPAARHAAVALPDPCTGERIVLVTTQRDASCHPLAKGARALGISERVVPKQVLVVDALPLLASGKLDYSAIGHLAETLAANT